MVKRICFAAMTVLVMLSACGEASQQESPAEDALEQYRNMAGAELAARVSCTWNGEAREYLLDCTYVPEGESKVEVQEPEELAGLTAVVDGETLGLRYEGDCLDAGTISDEGISPAACLPRLLDALRTGWLLEENEETWNEVPCMRLCVDQSGTQSGKIISTIWLRQDDGKPLRGEIAVDGEIILTAEFTSFSFYDTLEES